MEGKGGGGKTFGVTSMSPPTCVPAPVSLKQCLDKGEWWHPGLAPPQPLALWNGADSPNGGAVLVLGELGAHQGAQPGSPS